MGEGRKNTGSCTSVAPETQCTVQPVFGDTWKVWKVIWGCLGVGIQGIWRYLEIPGGVWGYLGVPGGAQEVFGESLEVFGVTWRYLGVPGGVWGVPGGVQEVFGA